MIAVIILIIVIILLISFTLTRFHIKGGEYRKLVSSDDYHVEISPSVSQLVLDLKYREAVRSFDGIIKFDSKIPEIGDPYKLLASTVEYLKEKRTIFFNGRKHIISAENADHLISDAHIDALLIANECSRIFAVCEYEPKTIKRSGEKRLFSNEYGNGSQMITMITNKMNDRDYADYVNEGIDIVARETSKNCIKLKEAILRSCMLYKYNDKYVCNTVISNLIVGKKYGDQCRYNFNRSIVERSENSPINVFLEFTYDTFINIATAYDVIHRFTYDVISAIFRKMDNHKNFNTCIIRIMMSKDSTIVNKDMILINGELPDPVDNRILIDTADHATYNHIVVPPSQSFAYDEYIDATRNGVNYHIQIEDSEGADAHKSNLVEFVLRNYTDDKTIVEILLHFGYNLNRNNKYTYLVGNKHDQVIQVKDSSVFYKANKQFCDTHFNVSKG